MARQYESNDGDQHHDHDEYREYFLEHVFSPLENRKSAGAAFF
jgi:hypothetical protein